VRPWWLGVLQGLVVSALVWALGVRIGSFVREKR
jgi:hypothetical protein